MYSLVNKNCFLRLSIISFDTFASPSVTYLIEMSFNVILYMTENLLWIICAISAVEKIVKFLGIRFPDLVKRNLTLSHRFQRPFSRWIWVSRYQNFSILDFIGDKDDGGGGDNWSCKTCKAPVKQLLSPPTNPHPAFYRPDALPCRPANGVRSLKQKLREI